LSLEDIGRSKSEEVIILRDRNSEDYWDKGKQVPYPDTDVTRRMRSQLQLINEGIASSNIEFNDSVLRPGRTADPSDITLRRIFSRKSFESGGRLYGGFWQSLNEYERLQGILVDGEEVAEIDYGQVAIRIMYGRVSAPVPKGDLYEIPGIPKSCRQAVKIVCNSMTFKRGELSKKPEGTKEKLPDLHISVITRLIKEAHSPIAHLFGRSIGHELQFTESQVMVEVLLKLRQDNITALPVHDAVVVPISALGKAESVMRSVFANNVGAEASLTSKTRTCSTTRSLTRGVAPIHLHEATSLHV
jgi:hypothetical protein